MDFHEEITNTFCDKELFISGLSTKALVFIGEQRHVMLLLKKARDSSFSSQNVQSGMRAVSQRKIWSPPPFISILWFPNCGIRLLWLNRWFVFEAFLWISRYDERKNWNIWYGVAAFLLWMVYAQHYRAPSFANWMDIRLKCGEINILIISSVGHLELAIYWKIKRLR